jgi:hypothetical protein
MRVEEIRGEKMTIVATMAVEVETNQNLSPNRNLNLILILILILIRDYFLDQNLLMIRVKRIRTLRVVRPSLQLIHA